MGKAAKAKTKPVTPGHGERRLRAWEVNKLEAEIMAAQMARKLACEIVWGVFLSSARWNEFRKHELLYEWRQSIQTVLTFKAERFALAYVRRHKLGGQWVARPFPVLALREKHAVRIVEDLDEEPMIFTIEEYDLVDSETGEVRRGPVPWSMRDHDRWMLKVMAIDLAGFLETLVSNDQGMIIDACPCCLHLCPGCNRDQDLLQ